jgi:hypothetical protein
MSEYDESDYPWWEDIYSCTGDPNDTLCRQHAKQERGATDRAKQDWCSACLLAGVPCLPPHASTPIGSHR